jgi:hypothetical protein
VIDGVLACSGQAAKGFDSVHQWNLEGRAKASHEIITVMEFDPRKREISRWEGDSKRQDP